MKVRFDEIEDAEIVSEQAQSLNDGDNAFLSFLAKQIESLTGNERGGWITEGLVLADLTENPTGLRKAYKAGKPEIDTYFQQVDLEKVVNQVGPGVQQQIITGIKERVKNNVPGFIAGTLFTAVTIFAIKEYRQRND